MKDDLIKDAFSKVKDHISGIDGDLSLTKLDLLALKRDSQTLASSFTDLIATLQNYIQQTQQLHQEQSHLLQQIVYYQDQTNQQLQKLSQSITQDITNNFNLLTKHVEEIKTISSRTAASLTQNSAHTPTQNPTHPEEKPTFQHKVPTNTHIPAHIPTNNQPFYSLISSYKETSIGNDGVPTDKPTDRQTDQHTTQQIINTNPPKESIQITRNFQEIPKNSNQSIEIPLAANQHTKKQYRPTINLPSKIDHLQKASEILSSLDSLKKEIRLKFKRLTNQELLIFSTIYQLEEEGNLVDYHMIAEVLALSESSVRDYVQKIINKGIPVDKEKINNKRILLAISPDLKKIASLDTIMQLRDL